MSAGPVSPAVLSLTQVGLIRNGTRLLDQINFTVEAGSSWIVIGANGSGKTSLVRICSLYEHPSSGTVELLGQTLGQTDVRTLRRRVALVSPALADMIRPQLTATEVVVCAKYAALEPWWHQYDHADSEKALGLLHAQQVGFAATRPYGSLSSGERQRVLLARALMAEPDLILLDEPSAALDLGGREILVDRLDRLAANPSSAPIILVTHHVEEIPPSFTHVLALQSGRLLAAGPIHETLTSELISQCFGLPLTLHQHGSRFTARRS
ncbi:MAG: ATP-binding cassette domain-containing protein [Microthrixaceae bacterium]